MPELDRIVRLGRAPEGLTIEEKLGRLFEPPVPFVFRLRTAARRIFTLSDAINITFDRYDPPNTIRLLAGDREGIPLREVLGILPAGTRLMAHNEPDLASLEGEIPIRPTMTSIMADAVWRGQSEIIDLVVNINSDWQEAVESQDHDLPAEDQEFIPTARGPTATVVSIPRSGVPPRDSEYKSHWTRLLNEQSSEELIISGDGATTQVTRVREYVIRASSAVDLADWMFDDGNLWNVSGVSPEGRARNKEIRAVRVEVFS